jgi:hypothetical protein
MLKPAKITETPAANRLIQLWAARYLPDLSVFPAQKGQFPVAALVESASEAGRAKTVERTKQLLQLNCEMAGLETNSLFSYIPNIVDLAEARRLAHCAERVYSRMLDIYLQQPPPNRYLQFIDASSTLFIKLALPALLLPMITQLSDALEPLLLELQEQHIHARDQRTIGFITTQFHFTNREILKQLSLCEQVLLTPYLKFVEEQVCIPWQRLCLAASNHPTSSPKLLLIEQMLPLGHEISQAVYAEAVTQYGNSCSRRGPFCHPEIAASTIRDLNMFQGYLWLSLLEGNLGAIEMELVPLCQAVFPAVGVSWQLVKTVLELLIQQLYSRVAPSQLNLLLPYTRALRQVFTEAVSGK